MVWRRPAGPDEPAYQRTEVSRERVVEPVQAGGPQVNVNQQSPIPAYAAAPVVAPSPVRVAVWRAQRVIYYVFGIIEAIIAIRFVLKLIAANPQNPFTQGVYAVSWIFAFPFSGVVSNANLGGGSIIEFFSLIAILVYILASVALARLLDLLV